jgi:hypothetical protein
MTLKVNETVTKGKQTWVPGTPAVEAVAAVPAVPGRFDKEPDTSVKTFNLPLTAEQTVFLMTLLIKVGGDPDTTIRGYGDEIQKMLPPIPVPFEGTTSENASIYFAASSKCPAFDSEVAKVLALPATPVEPTEKERMLRAECDSLYTRHRAMEREIEYIRRPRGYQDYYQMPRY